MKHKTGPMCSGVVVMMLAACGGQPNGAAQENAIRVLESQIVEVASQINRAASAAVDPDTRLDGAKAGPGPKLTIDYTLVNPAATGVDSSNFDTREAPTIRQGGCGNSALRALIDQGAVVVLQYRDLKGNPLGTVTLDRNACNSAMNHG